MADWIIWTVARNDKTSFYEVHKAGCAHLNARHMEPSGQYAGQPGAVADAFQAGNDGCLTRLGPCARKAAPQWRGTCAYDTGEGAYGFCPNRVPTPASTVCTTHDKGA
jgi:hypothetical protein